jgi:hypothetical protein
MTEQVNAMVDTEEFLPIHDRAINLAIEHIEQFRAIRQHELNSLQNSPLLEGVDASADGVVEQHYEYLTEVIGLYTYLMNYLPELKYDYDDDDELCN